MSDVSRGDDRGPAAPSASLSASAHGLQNHRSPVPSLLQRSHVNSPPSYPSPAKADTVIAPCAATPHRGAAAAAVAGFAD